MREHRPDLAFAILTLLAFGVLPASAQVAVLTRNYNNQRTGTNVSETILNATNVNSNQFGRLFSLPVDDQVYAGILYVPGLQISGGTHNVIYVATSNNTVYAFDADTLGPSLWSRNFNESGRPGTSTDVGQGCGVYTDFRGNVGIIGTPVIDGTAGTIYFVTRTVEAGSTVQRLHALDITTGLDRANSPQIIQASVAGTGGLNGTVTFNPTTQNQRPALALSQQGIVYVAWASYCDTTPYFGWVIGYNSTSLAQVAVFNAAPNGSQAGIWMAGAGPVIDASGYVYYATGNGTFDGASGFGESLVKLTPNALTVLDYFAPSSYATLNSGDLDFGSAGPSMVPGTSLMVQGGKTGIIYLLNTSGLGHEVSGDTQISQFFQAVDTTIRPSATHHIHNASPMWNSPEGLDLFVWGENDYLHQYQFNTSKQTFNTPPAATGSILPPVGMPGGMLTVSANGSTAGSGIVWASVPRAGDANHFTVPGNLYAFNAETLALLWSSTGTGQDLLNFSKGSAPIVANGKVYVGSTSRFVSAYGLNGSAPPSQDLALNKSGSSSTPCSSSQSAAQAFNGSFSGGLNDKWCSSVANPWLMVDLGTTTTISRFVVEHAGAGGEAFNLNTAAFNIQVSTDGVNFTPVVNVSGNVDSITTHDIAPTTARFVQLNIITPTQTTDTNARIYEFQVFAPTAGATADFSMTVTPGSISVVPGNTTSLTGTAIALNGFGGNIALSATGLPAGASAAFSPSSLNNSGDLTATITASCATAPGAYPISIVGTSGGLQHSVNVTLTVNAVAVTNLCPAYNRIGLVVDGTTFTSGLDRAGNAYSANLLGSTVNFGGASFQMGPANAFSAVSSATVALQPGQYSKLIMLATAVNGSQTSQTFTVGYSDGTNSSFTQSLSDWGVSQGYAGESIAASMAYRDVGNGGKKNGTYRLYGYSFSLNAAKVATSFTLPNNSNVVVLALALIGAGGSPDFSISAGPSSQTVTAGNATTYTATIAALNGFTGNVTLSASGLPAGATPSFNTNPLTGGAGSSTLSISTTSATPAGNYTVTITGTSSALQHSTTVSFNVAGFTISATPGSQTVAPGSGATYTATIAALNGFSGSVMLSANGLPTGATPSFNNNPVVGSGPSTLSISTTSGTPTGGYTVTITGASGSLQRSATVILNVGAGTPSTPVNLSSVYNVSGIVTDGSTFASNGGMDRAGHAYSSNLLGSVVSFGGVSFNIGPANAPNAVTSTAIPLPPGQYSTLSLLATGLNGNQASQSFVVTYTDGTTSPFTQSLSDWSVFQNFSGESAAVNMAYRDVSNGTKANATHLYGYSFSLNAAKTVSSITLPTNNNVVLVAATLVGGTSSPDFSISSTPSSQSVAPGSGTSYTATITALSGFSGNVTLSTGALPTGVTASFNTNPVIGSGTSTVSISTTAATPAGSYPVTITGTSGALQHSTTVTLNVGDFSISAAPSSQTVTPGSGTSYTATITALSGFSGNVTLSTGALPTGVTASFNTNPVIGSGTSTVSISTTAATPAGSYPVTINGTSGALQHSTTVTLNVGDFSISAAPSSQTVTAGNGTSYTATITALSGFSGNVTLSTSALPTGVTASFNTNPVIGSGTSTVSISTTAATPAGSYSVTLVGTSGALQHTTTVTLNISGAASSTTQVNLSSVYNVSGIVADGSTFASNGGLDRGGYAYSANLLGSALTLGGTSFSIGPANVPDVVSSTTIPLPAGQYSTLAILGTGINGNQLSQTFTVTYTDATTSSFTQNLSDWFLAQNYVGESIAQSMAYRDLSNGTEDNKTFHVYGYSFPLNAAKTVSSITLPSNSNVVVLAMTLSGTGSTADFSISAAPSLQTVTAGNGTSYTATITALSGFSGNVTLSTSALPTGVTASFNTNPVIGSGTSTVSISTTTATPAGSYSVTLVGTSGALQHTTTVTLNISGAASSTTQVNLSSVYNVSGIVADGSTFASNGGLDRGGHAYSANLLGSALTLGGTSFSIGPANVPDVVSSTTIPLPAGQYSTLAILGTGINGNQLSQTFTVTYTDATTSSFTQNLSDWFLAQNYVGESIAQSMAYRDLSNGTEDNKTFHVYGYSFPLNAAKTVSSITLPSNSNVVVLAMTLVP